MRAIDINCDMAESFGAYRLGADDALMSVVSSANIACGFHAGDPNTMAAALALAQRGGVQAGAHPGFQDLYGFGRRVIRGDSPAEIERQVIYQIGALQALARAAGTEVRHVKPHGALANLAAEESDLAMAIARAVKAADPTLIFLVMPGMETEKAGERLRLALAREIYADRAYADTGNLLPRRLEGAVIHDPEAAGDRVLGMLSAGAISCASGKTIPARIDSVCVHSDTPGAVDMATRLRARLESAGYLVRPMAETIGAG